MTFLWRNSKNVYGHTVVTLARGDMEQNSEINCSSNGLLWEVPSSHSVACRTVEGTERHSEET